MMIVVHADSGTVGQLVTLECVWRASASVCVCNVRVPVRSEKWV